MNSKLQRSITVVSIGAMALVMCACGKKGGPPAPPPVMVNLATAIQTNTPVVIPAYGLIQERESVDVVPQVSGILQACLVQEGAMVTNGQALFQIDPRDYQMRVQQAESAVAVDRSNLEVARSTLQRNQPLVEKRLISPDLFDVIKAKVTALEGQVRMDESTLELARLNLSRCTILAPISGICSKRYIDAGNLVSAGMSRLTNIRNYDPMRLECSVSEQYLPAVRSAMEAGVVNVTVTSRGDTNSYPGTLLFMDNAVNPAAGTILLRGVVPNPEMKLWANQFVDVKIIVAMQSGAVMVPESAVMLGKTSPYLYVVSGDQKAELRLVKTGVRHNNRVQIVEGVAGGETVVSVGQLKLYPGATVIDASKLPAAGQGR